MPTDTKCKRLFRRSSGWMALASVCMGSLASLAPAAESEFERDIRPVLERQCIACHDGVSAGAAVDLRRKLSEPAFRASPKLMSRIREAVAAHLMPPREIPVTVANKPGTKSPRGEVLSDATRARFVTWIDRVLPDAERAVSQPVDEVRLRRLTRVEFANTVQDTYGMRIDVKRWLPADARSPSGYENQTALLGSSPELIEKYLLVAEQIAQGSLSS